MMKDTDLKYIPVKKVFEGKYLSINDVLMTMDRNHDVIEKIVKAGLNNLLDEIIHHGIPNEINTNGIRLNDILRLDRAKTKMTTSMDCTLRELKTLQAAQMARMSLDESLVREIAKYTQWKSLDDICLFLQRKNLRKTLNYLNKLQQEAGVAPEIALRDYEDFLGQLQRLSILDKSARFPKNFYRVHEELSEEIREKDLEFARENTKEKNAILRKKVKEVKKDYETRSNAFVIVWPRSKADFVKEGQLQHNCVGGYFERCAKGETVVFFLRKKEEPGKPFCTVEFRNGKMIQCRTIYNGHAPEDAMKYMKKIEEHYKRQQKIKEAM